MRVEPLFPPQPTIMTLHTWTAAECELLSPGCVSFRSPMPFQDCLAFWSQPAETCSRVLRKQVKAARTCRKLNNTNLSAWQP